MQISEEDLAFCLRKTNEIKDYYVQYFVGGDGLPRDADYLRVICADYLSKRVTKNFVHIEWSDEASYRGFYVAEPDEDFYRVFLYQGMPVEWQRFVLCKELFHVVLDVEKYRTVDVLELIRDMSMDWQKEENDPSPAVVSEKLAEIAAMEFLFPYQDRTHYKANGQIKYADVAQAYGIPQYYVEQYLTDDRMAALSCEGIRG